MISSCLYRKSNWHYQECQFWRVGRFCGTHGYPILRQALLGIDPYQSGEEVVFEAKTIPVLDLSPKTTVIGGAPFCGQIQMRSMQFYSPSAKRW